ncbi:MAG: acylneuraminate cytidylyltransferase family protein [Planctomycetota bacterium]
MTVHRLAVILARAGSKGLPHKNVLPVAGRPMIAHTINHAKAAREIDAICLTTDDPRAAEIGRAEGLFVVNRPAELATDTATVDAAARHAVDLYEKAVCPVTHVALLYANVPVRPEGVIDRAMRHLIDTGADSVRSLAPVTKQHPDWIHRLDGDRMVQFRRNSIYRRQELEPLYYHDGAVVAVTRRALFATDPDDNHAFMGADRRGVVVEEGMAVDVDSTADLQIAEAVIRNREQRRLDGPLTPAGLEEQ